MMMTDDPLDAILAKRKAQSADPLDKILANRKPTSTGNADLRSAQADDTRVAPKPKQAPKGEGPGVVRSAATGAAAGVPLLNKAMAAMGVLAGGKYDAMLSDIAHQQQVAKVAHPTAYKAGEVGGNLATAAGINALLPGAGLAAQGAIFGGLQGLNDAKGDVGDYAWEAGKDAAENAIGGKVLGAVARPVVSVVARGASKVIPNEVLDAIQTATGKNRRALADLSSTVKGAGKTPQQLLQESESLVPSAMVKTGRDQIAQAATDLAEVGKRFPKAYESAQAIDDPALDQFLAEGQGQKLWQAAQKQAEKYGRELPTKRVQEMVLPTNPSPTLQARLQSMPSAGTKEIPIPDPEALHFMRKAAASDPAMKDAFETIKGAVKQHVPDLESAIEDYAKAARKYDVLAGGKEAPEYLSAKSTRTHPLARKPTEPHRIEEAFTGVPGVERALENMTPEEQRLFRATAQQNAGERLAGGLKIGDPENNAAWQNALFGSPEAYQVFEAGARARPPQSAMESVREDIASGWIPHSRAGTVVKAGQVISRMARGHPHLTNPTPMTAEEVLRAMLDYQRGKGLLTPLTNAAAGSGLQSFRE